MNRPLLFALTLAVIIVTPLGTYLLLGRPRFSYQPGVSNEADAAVRRAQQVYRDKKLQGDDLRSGPCLSNDLMPGWVADLVHNPRSRTDDLPQNQCRAYLEGKASHFVELDLDGNVVRVQ